MQFLEHEILIIDFQGASHPLYNVTILGFNCYFVNRQFFLQNCKTLNFADFSVGAFKKKKNFLHLLPGNVFEFGPAINFSFVMKSWGPIGSTVLTCIGYKEID